MRGARQAGRRWLTWGATALLLAGCGTGPGPSSQTTGDGSEATTPMPATQPPGGQDELAPFYSQKLQWGACGADVQAPDLAKCTWAQVPIDYAKPDAGTTRLRLLKVSASGKSQGALLVNPGGPGGSAVDYAASADFIVSGQIRRAFDIVGVDPRGVGHSEPLNCVDAARVDQMLGMDPTPDDEAEYNQLEDSAKSFGQACEQKYPKILGHVSTLDAARDMDIVRASLGQEKLTYLGKSYGTFLGATYAGLFPQRVGRLVLDGAIAPDLTNEQMNLGQATGFETATRAYVAACVKDGDCPLGSNLESGMTGLQQFLKKLDSQPLPVQSDPRVKKLTEGWASLGLARAMYDESSWDGLTDALRAAKRGDGTGLFELAKEYADRQDDGTYSGNIMQVITAVNCLDRGSQRKDFAAMQTLGKEFAQEAPTWGPFMVWGSTSCDQWPIKPVDEPHKISADGSAPIVVVGTTRDPATPYEWAQSLATQLQKGHLITFDGDGHTAYMRSNSCVDGAVDAYFLKGTVPADDLKC
ncbi:MAG: alpha/beta hydrolase [Micrococcales bacterium]|nr:alpha/beta hydrolase [Micrococcales bacterium]